MGSQFVHKSEDMGRTWTKISPDERCIKIQHRKSGGLSVDNSGAENTVLFYNCRVTIKRKVIWAELMTEMYKLRRMEVKHGLMWLLTLLDFKKHLVLSHWSEYFGEGIAYAVFEGHATNDYTPYTYKTTDFGKHGNQLLILILMVLFVTFKKILPMKTYYTEKGLYITIDGGKLVSFYQ
jgi:hypothetical protein